MCHFVCHFLCPVIGGHIILSHRYTIEWDVIIRLVGMFLLVCILCICQHRYGRILTDLHETWHRPSLGSQKKKHN